ncbi:MAG: YceI family protein [Actinomycetota bacterium]
MIRKRWVVNEDTATIAFTATSSVHTIRAKGTVRGWLEATIDDGAFAPGTELNGELLVPLAGLSSGNSLIDREMRRRVDVGVFPEIKAVVESTESIAGSDATIDGIVAFLGGGVLVEGEIELHEGPRLTGVGEFDVRWWGLEPPRLLMFQVDPIVTVEIDLPLSE